MERDGEEKDGNLSPQGKQRWDAMMQRGIAAVIAERPGVFGRRARRGIPGEYRWSVWKAAARVEDRRLPGMYEKLLTPDTEWQWQIDLDIPRTFPTNEQFDADHRRSLTNILHAYANLDTHVGYCQGMNFVVGLLLLVASGGTLGGRDDLQRVELEEEVFWMVVCLMEDGQLSGFYRGDFLLLRRYLWACDQLVAENLPKLQNHFAKESIQQVEYLHQWYLKLFIDCLPMHTVLIFWDAVICAGASGGSSLEALLTITVALLASMQDQLLAERFEGILAVFKQLRPVAGAADAAVCGRELLVRSEKIRVPARVLQRLRAPLPPPGDEGKAESESFDVASSSPSLGSPLGRYLGSLGEGLGSWWGEAREHLKPGLVAA